MNNKTKNAFYGFIIGFLIVFGGCSVSMQTMDREGTMLTLIFALIVGGIGGILGALISNNKDV